MNVLLKMLPLFAVAIGLWRVVPAVKSGAGGFSAAQAESSIGAADLAGQLSAQMSERGNDLLSFEDGEDPVVLHPREAPKVVTGQRTRVQLDGWKRPYQVKKTAGKIEVVSCGEDGECGTEDDIIEVVNAKGERKRLDNKPTDRAPKPIRPPT